MQAVHMTLEANGEKPAALSLSRPMPGHLVDTPGQSFTALLNRSALSSLTCPLRKNHGQTVTGWLTALSLLGRSAFG